MRRRRPSWTLGVSIVCLAVGLAGAAADAAWARGKGSTRAGAAPVVPSPAIAFAKGPGSPLAVGGDPFALVKTSTRPEPGPAVLEIPDLVVSNPATGSISVLLGDGHGGFALGPGSPVSTGGSGPSAIAASGLGYFTGALPSKAPGGSTAASVLAANSGSNTLSLLFGNGAGAFSLSPGSPFASGGVDPTALGPFVDRGGTERLAVGNSGSATVSVLTAASDSTGYSSVVPESPFATGLHAISGMVVGDFNGDGNPDLAVVDGSGASSANVAVLLGNAQGGFTLAPGSPFSSGGSGPVAIAADDFNDDSRLDLVVANQASNTISILLGNGNGTFSPAPGSPFSSGGSGPVGVAPWDLNGDGRADLAVINGASNSLAVYAGNGTGAMTAQPGFPVPAGVTGTTAIVAGDLNGDGLADLAVAGRQSKAVSVFLNTTLAPSFPLAGRTRLRRDGTVRLQFNAPAAGMFQDVLSVGGRRGRLVAYGCGEAIADKAGPITLQVTPTAHGKRVFRRVRTLRLRSQVSFLRRSAVAPVGAGGGGATSPAVRHVARRGHRPRRVIVHVASVRASGEPRARAASTGPSLAQLSSLGCIPFPSL